MIRMHKEEDFLCQMLIKEVLIIKVIILVSSRIRLLDKFTHHQGVLEVDHKWDLRHQCQEASCHSK
jgi:hypothetical protein